jgi:hypothetical protein
MPGEGRLEAMFAYLEVDQNSRMRFGMSDFQICDWKDFYRNDDKQFRRMRHSREERKLSFTSMTILIKQERN